MRSPRPVIVAFALLVTACAADRDVVLDASVPETEPTSIATTATTESVSTSTTVAPVVLTQAVPNVSAMDAVGDITALIGRIQANPAPFSPDLESIHFVAQLTMLDTAAAVPAARVAEDYIAVLGVEGEASATEATFTYSDTMRSTDGRIIAETAWIEGDTGWQSSTIADPAAEVEALTYGNWAALIIQMIDLTSRFTETSRVTSEPWEGGEHLTITAESSDATDPLVIAGLPTYTELWLDENDVIRRAQVEGYVLWAQVYVPAALTLRIDQLASPFVPQSSPLGAP